MSQKNREKGSAHSDMSSLVGESECSNAVQHVDDADITIIDEIVATGSSARELSTRPHPVDAIGLFVPSVKEQKLSNIRFENQSTNTTAIKDSAHSQVDLVVGESGFLNPGPTEQHVDDNDIIIIDEIVATGSSARELSTRPHTVDAIGLFAPSVKEHKPSNIQFEVPSLKRPSDEAVTQVTKIRRFQRKSVIGLLSIPSHLQSAYNDRCEPPVVLFPMENIKYESEETVLEQSGIMQLESPECCETPMLGITDDERHSNRILTEKFQPPVVLFPMENIKYESEETVLEQSGIMQLESPECCETPMLGITDDERHSNRILTEKFEPPEVLDEYVEFEAEEEHFEESDGEEPRDDIYGDLNPREDLLSMTNAQIAKVLKSYSIYGNTKRLVFEKDVLSKLSESVYITTQKSAPLLFYNSCIYRPAYEDCVGNVISRCDTTGQCKGKAECIRATGNLTVLIPCNHAKKTDEILMKIGTRQAKIDKSRGCSTSNAISNLTDYAERHEIAYRIVKDKSIGQNIRRALIPSSDQHFPPMINWEQWGATSIEAIHDDCFSYEQNGRCSIMWTTRESRQYFNQCKVLHTDGKFSEIAHGFKQLVIISTEIGEHRKPVPLVFCLTTSKDASTYTGIFQTCKQLGINPEAVYSDFEQAAINAARNVWPSAAIHLCFRHFKVALRKHLRKSLKIKDDAQSPVLKKFLLTAYSMAFVETAKVREYFEYFSTDAVAKDVRLSEVINYMNSTYVGIRCNPLYSFKFWSCRESLVKNRDFTNNISENLFSQFKSKADSSAYIHISNTFKTSLNWTESIHQQIRMGRSASNSQYDRNAQFRSASLKEKAFDAYPSPGVFFATIVPLMTLPRVYK